MSAKTDSATTNGNTALMGVGVHRLVRPSGRPLAHRQGLCDEGCEYCQIEKEIAYERGLAASDPEPQSDDCNVICPHCLASYQAESGDFNETETEQECSECGEKYIMYSSFSVTHHTRALPNA